MCIMGLLLQTYTGVSCQRADGPSVCLHVHALFTEQHAQRISLVTLKAVDAHMSRLCPG